MLAETAPEDTPVEQYIPVKVQFAVWGYALTGHDPGGTAWFVETGSGPPFGPPWWDRTNTDLRGETLDGMPVPRRFACYWIGEHMRRTGRVDLELGDWLLGRGK